MTTAVITGSCGLIGSEAALHFGDLGLDVIGIDNDMRATFFGPAASTQATRSLLTDRLGKGYVHKDVDIRDRDAIEAIFKGRGSDIELVIHTAAQPSHDWAASDPHTDFGINAVGTLNVLDACRQSSPRARFIFTSTNKVYGDTPNRLPLLEGEKRFEVEPGHPFATGITEEMSVDTSLHSVFGASKLAADVLVQEYGRYFDMATVCFRGGTLTGPRHAAAELHGFLAYLMQCAMTGRPYTVFGYKGKQVRDAIHSADLISAFAAYFAAPRPGEVYNIGGGPTSNCSVLEAVELAESITGAEMTTSYDDTNRIGDHIWWVSSLERFQAHYPGWALTYDVPAIMREMYAENADRWSR